MADSPREDLRMQLRSRRRELPPPARTLATMAINQRLISSDFFVEAQTIALFAAFDGEPDLSPAIDAALQLQKHVFLPVLPKQSRQPLLFNRLQDRNRTRTNHYGIEEPAATPNGSIAASALDLVIVPLVGFDSDCNRLGMGGGFYDRTFEFVANYRHPGTPRLVGVAFEVQKVRRLDTQPWDVPLWRVMTEADLYKPAPEPMEI